MKKKSGTHFNSHSRFCILGFLIFLLTYPMQGMTGEMDTYRYKLEQNNNNKVCTHMSDVYNQFFKKPFDTQEYIKPFDHPEYVKGGIALPNLLPGAKVNLGSLINMGFSFYPSSPEFDAVKWQIGNEAHGDSKTYYYKGNPTPYLTPFIAADIDLNNDGHIKTVIKHAFMSCYIPGCESGHADVMSIFRKGDIDLTKGPIELDTFFKGQNGSPPLAVIYGPQSTCDLVRPFIYDGVTYLSCYHQTWIKDFMDFRNRTPDREYTDVLKYQGVEELPDGRKPLKAETVCRFRMTVAK